MSRKLIFLAILALSAMQIQAQTASEKAAAAKLKVKYHPSDKILSSVPWYNPSTKYVKLETTKDGIAKADLSEILSLAPEWRGRAKSELKLLNRGVEKPIYIDLPGETLQDQGTIYFLGSRAKGDTTWHDNYASSEPFYLYMDPAGNGMRFTLAQFSGGPPSATINKARINLHVEKDVRYNLSGDFFNPETGNGEGWYWDMLMPGVYHEKNKFTALIDVVPTEKPEDQVVIEAHVISLADTIKRGIYGDYFVPEYDIAFLANNDTIDKKKFINIRRETLSGVFNGDELYSGTNAFAVDMKQLYDKDNGYLGIEYFAIKGIVRPWAGIEGSFYTAETAADAYLEADGFTDPFAVAIDTLTNEIQFPATEKGYSVKFGAGPENLPFAYAVFNGSNYYSENRGAHLIFLKDGDFSGKSFGEDFNQAADYVESYQGAAVFIYNGTGALSGRLKSALKNKGANEVDALSGGESYAIFFETGSPASAVERRSKLGKVSYAGTILSPTGTSAKAKIRLRGGQNHAFTLSDAKQIEKVLVNPVNSTNLKSVGADSSIEVVIAYKDFKSEAQRLADHRMSRIKNATVRVVDVEDIYKEFTDGRKSPHAIREFLKIASQRSKIFKYVLLAGDASMDPRRNDPFSKSIDYVPTFGNPASDYWYICNDPVYPLNSSLMIGRLPFKSAAEAKAVVDKLIDYDTMAVQPWMKNFLFISGGGTEGEGEKEEFYNFGYNLNLETIAVPPLCGASDFVRKTSGSDGTESPAIISSINAGAGWWNFLGHGALNIFDIDGWEVSKISNYRKYGVLSTLACNTGAFADPNSQECRNETYLDAAERGVIAAMGSTTVGWKDIHPAFLRNMFYYMNGLIGGSQRRRLGDLFFYAKDQLVVDFDQPEANAASITTRYFFTFLGDPLTEYRIEPIPELYMVDQEINIVNEKGSSEFEENDATANITGKIHNAGIRFPGEFNTLCVHTYEGKRDSLYVILSSICKFNNFSFKVDIKNQPGRHLIEIYIDPSDQIDENNRVNNYLSREFYIYKRGLLPVEPMADWNVNAEAPLFRVINPESAKGTFKYEFKITDRKNGNLITESAPDEITVRKNSIDWVPKVKLELGARLLFSARLFFGNSSEPSGWLEIPFYASSEKPGAITIREKKVTLDYAGDKFDSTSIRNETLIQLDDEAQPYELSNGTDDANKFMTFNYNGKIIHDSKFDDGMHVYLIPMQYDTNAFTHRHYGMYGGSWWVDSASIDLYRFLKDTVPDDVYVVVVTSAGGWAVLNKYQKWRPESIGSMDSLRALMKEVYGSKLIDSVKQGDWPDEFDWRNSWCYVGKKWAKPDEVIEDLNPKGGVAAVSGSLIRYHLSGAYASLPIGPAYEWKTLTVDSLMFEGPDSKLKLYGVSKNGTQTELMILDTAGTYDLNSISTKDYPKLVIKALLKRDLKQKNPSFGYIKFAYLPPPEIAIAQDAVKASVAETMQGESLTTTFEVENLSFRTDAKNLQTSRKLLKNDIAFVDTTIVFERVGKASFALFEYSEATERLNGKIKLSITADPASQQSEPYYFNNSSGAFFSVYTDTIPPTLKLTIDGVEPNFGDFVLAKPRIVVTMEDNSPLDIKDSTNISVFLNGAYISSVNSDDYKFELFNEHSKLKARMSFTPKKLEFGENPRFPANNITVTGIDASGNVDTLDYSVNVALNGVASDMLFYPNPAYGGAGKVSYKFRAQDLNFISTVELYDMTGRKVGEWKDSPRLGSNVMNMDLRGLSPGVYFYRLSFAGSSYVPSSNGKLLISGN